MYLGNPHEKNKISMLIKLRYGEECNCVLISLNGCYFIRAACTIVAGEVIVITPWILRLIEDYIVNNEEEFEQWIKNTSWIQRTTIMLK